MAQQIQWQEYTSLLLRSPVMHVMVLELMEWEWAIFSFCVMRQDPGMIQNQPAKVCNFFVTLSLLDTYAAKENPTLMHVSVDNSVSRPLWKNSSLDFLKTIQL